MKIMFINPPWNDIRSAIKSKDKLRQEYFDDKNSGRPKKKYFLADDRMVFDKNMKMWKIERVLLIFSPNDAMDDLDFIKKIVCQEEFTKDENS